MRKTVIGNPLRSAEVELRDEWQLAEPRKTALVSWPSAFRLEILCSAMTDRI